uniref:Uncharacterized protein n=1 Tax=Sphingomonas sp. NS2 TaxID=908605 RepID=A0A0D4ZZH8_9SPHN|nr:hypothetical protein plasmid201_170 [Sphingomonas sp. NS2]
MFINVAAVTDGTNSSSVTLTAVLYGKRGLEAADQAASAIGC